MILNNYSIADLSFSRFLFRQLRTGRFVQFLVSVKLFSHHLNLVLQRQHCATRYFICRRHFQKLQNSTAKLCRIQKKGIESKFAGLLENNVLNTVTRICNNLTWGKSLTPILVHRHLALTKALKEIDKMPTNWWGRQNAALLKFDPKPSEAAFSANLPNFDEC